MPTPERVETPMDMITELRPGGGILLGNTIVFASPADAAAFVSTLNFSGISQPASAALTALASGSQFVKFVGPTSAVKTFTLPDASASLATTAYADSAAATAAAAAAAALVNSSPSALDTLKELADALGDDANFAATVTTALAGKQALSAVLTALAGGSAFVKFTGPAGTVKTFTLPDASATLATTAYADAAASTAAAGTARVAAANVFTDFQTMTGLLVNGYTRLFGAGGAAADWGNLTTVGRLTYNGAEAIINSVGGMISFYSSNAPSLQITGGSDPLCALGGTSASFPALKRVGATVSFRLADDSADARITVAGLSISSSPTTSSGLGASDVWNNGGVLNIGPGASGPIVSASGVLTKIAPLAAGAVTLDCDAVAAWFGSFSGGYVGGSLTIQVSGNADTVVSFTQRTLADGGWGSAAGVVYVGFDPDAGGVVARTGAQLVTDLLAAFAGLSPTGFTAANLAGDVITFTANAAGTATTIRSSSSNLGGFGNATAGGTDSGTRQITLAPAATGKAHRLLGASYGVPGSTSWSVADVQVGYWDGTTFSSVRKVPLASLTATAAGDAPLESLANLITPVVGAALVARTASSGAPANETAGSDATLYAAFVTG